ncbi:MAG: hypothetical protein HY042_05890 [Spirochaetia bacterium]|nr:hypothetical protein [Spirochaetia bacterium]
MNDLKKEILVSIGLGMGDSIFEGRSSAVLVRMMAAQRLQPAMQRLADYGEPILPPSPKMMQLVYFVVRNGETSSYTVRESYKVISSVIDEHLRLYGKPPRQQEQDMEAAYNDLALATGRRKKQERQEHQNLTNRLWADMIG